MIASGSPRTWAKIQVNLCLVSQPMERTVGLKKDSTYEIHWETWFYISGWIYYGGYKVMVDITVIQLTYDTTFYVGVATELNITLLGNVDNFSFLKKYILLLN